jgi:hypothetical protein
MVRLDYFCELDVVVVLEVPQRRLLLRVVSGESPELERSSWVDRVFSYNSSTSTGGNKCDLRNCWKPSMSFGKKAGQWSLQESIARLVVQLLRSQGVGVAHLGTVAVREVVRAKANRTSTKRFIRVIEWTIIEWHALYL